MPWVVSVQVRGGRKNCTDLRFRHNSVSVSLRPTEFEGRRNERNSEFRATAAFALSPAGCVSIISGKHGLCGYTRRSRPTRNALLFSAGFLRTDLYAAMG